MSDNSKLIRHGVLSGTYPQRVYKYRPLNHRTLDAIRSSSLWFAQAKTFNDPFDCNLSETQSHTLSDIQQYLKNIRADAKTVNEMQQQFRRDPMKVREMCIHARETAINSKGILSLSMTHNNILMWSHYAENHTGVVLGFEILQDVDFFDTPVKVKYLQNYQELNYFRDRDRAVTQNISTKAISWDYEQEIRIIKNESKAWAFSPMCLREIYFGCKASDSKIEEMKELCCRQGFNHVIFYKARIVHAAFDLDFDPI